MKCRCHEIVELEADEAERYAEDHLHEVGTDSTGWIRYFVCPVTGVKWVMDRAFGEVHGGGWARLRRAETEGEENGA
jgi:hypothetical protein